MSETLLDELNPGIDFHRLGAHITIVNPDRTPPSKKVARIVIDKARRSLLAFDASNDLLAFYPASIGSKEKPAPSGVFKVAGVTRNPVYTYDPKYRFKEIKAKHRLTIRPGPNNPVGLVWIDLTIPSYGIHGSPAPEHIGKTESHGCIRLTNWDALDLASTVGRGTIVDFRG
jgi:lipoprotein-anchoring transpeptidase ErfK/SrfK